MGYTKANRPAIKVRTLNAVEIEVVQVLEAAGWTVVKRGWPDMLAWRDGKVRFIEVKRAPGHGLKKSQAMVAGALQRILGVHVELLHPGNREDWDSQAGRKGVRG